MDEEVNHESLIEDPFTLNLPSQGVSFRTKLRKEAQENMAEWVRQPEAQAVLSTVLVDYARDFVKSVFDSAEPDGPDDAHDPIYPRHISKLYSLSSESHAMSLSAQFKPVSSTRNLIRRGGRAMYEQRDRSSLNTMESWRAFITTDMASGQDSRRVVSSSTLASHRLRIRSWFQTERI